MAKHSLLMHMQCYLAFLQPVKHILQASTKILLEPILILNVSNSQTAEVSVKVKADYCNVSFLSEK